MSDVPESGGYAGMERRVLRRHREGRAGALAARAQASELPPPWIFPHSPIMDTPARRVERSQRLEKPLCETPDDPCAGHQMREAALVIERILADFPRTRETLRVRSPHHCQLSGRPQN